MAFRILFVSFLLCMVPLAGRGDENLTTPYIMLDPGSLTTHVAEGAPVARAEKNPREIVRRRNNLILPRIVRTEPTSGTDVITLENANVKFGVTIDDDRRARICSLKSNVTGTEFLSTASEVFRTGDANSVSSNSYRVHNWNVSQGVESAELAVQLRPAEPKAAGLNSVTWVARIHRSRGYVEQSFRSEPGDVRFSQDLETTGSLHPVMPANLFALGFTNGKPNLTDDRRFEYVKESDHVGYNAVRDEGLSAFAADTAGQESITHGRLSISGIACSASRSSAPGGRFILQPFTGPVELGFAQLRDFIQREYSVQKLAPAAFEWNQFWLWQGGPVTVDYSVVTESRLFDTLQRVLPMGLEELHLDAGWQTGPGQWQLDPGRFPGGWDRIKKFNRTHGLSFHLWVNDANANSSEFLKGLIEKSDLNRIFIDRIVTDKTLEAIEVVRASYPALSVNVHGSTTSSKYWSWGNLHFLNHLNQIYFGEGQYWAWSNIHPEAEIAAAVDPMFPQKTDAERFFSKHDMAAGDLITRSAAYQAHWVWPFNCVIPPHGSIDWFEKRPLKNLKSRILTYLACKFKYEWGFDPARLTPETIRFHNDCTAWFKANRDYLAVYQHVLDPPDGVKVDGMGHLLGQSGYVFLFNPANSPQQVAWKKILWEPALALEGDRVALSDWSEIFSYTQLAEQQLDSPAGSVEIPAGEVKVIGINLPCDEILQRVRAERRRLLKSGD